MGRNNAFGQVASIAAMAVASYFAGPVAGQAAFVATSLISQRLATYDPVEGSRRDNLDGTTAEYGSMIPEVFGYYRVQGNVIWCKNLEERVSEEGGGKGSQGQKIYKYYANFACLLCEGMIVGVRRIWANNKLIYDNRQNFKKNDNGEIVVVENPNNETNLFNFTGDIYNTQKTLVSLTKRFSSHTINEGAFDLFYGTEDQEPSKHIEKYEGEGNVEAYSGRSYIVFKDLELTNFGNTIPSLSFEIVKDDVLNNNGELSIQEITRVDYNVGEIFGYGTSIVQKVNDFVKYGNKLLCISTLGISDKEYSEILAKRKIGFKVVNNYNGVPILDRAHRKLTNRAVGVYVIDLNTQKKKPLCLLLNANVVAFNFSEYESGFFNKVIVSNNEVFGYCNVIIPFSMNKAETRSSVMSQIQRNVLIQERDSINIQKTTYHGRMNRADLYANSYNSLIEMTSYHAIYAITHDELIRNEYSGMLESTTQNLIIKVRKSMSQILLGVKYNGISLEVFLAESDGRKTTKIIKDKYSLENYTVDTTKPTINRVEIDVSRYGKSLAYIQGTYNTDSALLFFDGYEEIITKKGNDYDILKIQGENTYLKTVSADRFSSIASLFTDGRDVFIFNQVNGRVIRHDTLLFTEEVLDMKIDSSIFSLVDNQKKVLHRSGLYSVYTQEDFILNKFTKKGISDELTSYLSTILKRLMEFSGLNEEQYDLTEIKENDKEVRGFIINNTSSIKDSFNTLSSVYGFNTVEINGKIVFKYKDNNPKAWIYKEELGCDFFQEEMDFSDLLKRELFNELEIPNKITFNFVDEELEYSNNAIDVITHELNGNVHKIITSALNLDANKAKNITEKIALDFYSSKETIEVNLGFEYDHLNVGDVVMIENEVHFEAYIITKKNYDGILIKLNLSRTTLQDKAKEINYSHDFYINQTEQLIEVKNLTAQKVYLDKNYTTGTLYHIAVDNDDSNYDYGVTINNSLYKTNKRIETILFNQEMSYLKPLTDYEKGFCFDHDSYIIIDKSDLDTLEFNSIEDEQELIDKPMLNTIYVGGNVIRFTKVEEMEDYIKLSGIIRHVVGFNNFNNGFMDSILFYVDESDLIDVNIDKETDLFFYGSRYNDFYMHLEELDKRLHDLSQENFSYDGNILEIKNIMSSFKEGEVVYKIKYSDLQVDHEEILEEYSTKSNKISLPNKQSLFVKYSIEGIESDYFKVK